ncbi:TetR/AcrR family transcriptional regulator [Streptomyces noursei]|uniref:TetR/AcrR family transcriptional regulator n=1 Tax=Streptomyces noursei TaxID=1971 RepID=UPI00081CA54C|nr:TetR/AcrR family transcriptional regulator [Streptomyces noursei]ANZ15472.1 transcriptional regulator, TetR family [Streptomyces noursei ATCC 11455]MCZ0992761.1 TetR/AcrR family transcriptional regulator [Streptomyces noursei]MCZ1018849.1 TetR/AcrR family transcriptional regulator [Streptomyces noursei]GGX22117.1 TetR family transcriptional regulator [Streptomyces noursei]
MSHEAAAPLSGGALTRSRILDAAAALMTSVGLTHTTTKQIAKEAGCSEAALYKHFRSKEEIFVQVLHERVPQFADALAELPDRAGDERGPAGHLEEVVRSALRFYRRSFPIAASLFASPELLATHRRKLDALGGLGPHNASRQLATYLAAEQESGRIAAGADPDAAANLLIGACFHRAFLDLFFDGEAPAGALRPAGEEEFVAETVRALLGGLSPSGGA